jgi:hypothetical protein
VWCSSIRRASWCQCTFSLPSCRLTGAHLVSSSSVHNGSRRVRVKRHCTHAYRARQAQPPARAAPPASEARRPVVVIVAAVVARRGGGGGGEIIKLGREGSCLPAEKDGDGYAWRVGRGGDRAPTEGSARWRRALPTYGAARPRLLLAAALASRSASVPPSHGPRTVRLRD